MKKKQWQIAPMVLCGMMTMAFRFDASSIEWMWNDHVMVPVILGLMSLIFMVSWIIDKRKRTEF